MSKSRSCRIRNHVPSVLCRYMDMNGILPTLQLGALRFASPADFTDENEFTFAYMPLSRAAIERKYDNPEARRNTENWAGLRFFSRREKIDKLWEVSKQKDIDIRRELQDRYRICCLTASSKNEYMWQNYAKEYTGAVLEFKFNSRRPIHPIEYSDTLPGYNKALVYNEGTYFYKIMCHKMSSFYREEEYRYILPADYVERSKKLREQNPCISDSANIFVDAGNYLNDCFEPSELKSVCLGHAILPENEEKVKTLLRESRYARVRLIKQRDDKSVFELENFR